MIYDLHVHIAGTDFERHGNFVCPRRQRSLAFRFFMRRFGLTQADIAHGRADDRVGAKMQAWLEASQVDRAVLLAFDGAYTRDGRPDWANTQLVTANDFVADIAEGNQRVLFGASVHPYRRDALEELERLISRGACLVKWLPSAQNIQPDDPACWPFYEALAHHHLPLLCHAGNEHTVGAFGASLNEPRRLKPALERGVTVIAAHCGARMFLHERCFLREWQTMAREYEHFYGDVSAFGLPVRAGMLVRMLRDEELVSKLLYGSDFPTATFPSSYVFSLGLREAVKLHGIRNPFDRAYLTLKRVGLPDHVFTRAQDLLRTREEASVCA